MLYSPFHIFGFPNLIHILMGILWSLPGDLPAILGAQAFLLLEAAVLNDAGKHVCEEQDNWQNHGFHSRIYGWRPHRMLLWWGFGAYVGKILFHRFPSLISIVATEIIYAWGSGIDLYGINYAMGVILNLGTCSTWPRPRSFLVHIRWYQRRLAVASQMHVFVDRANIKKNLSLMRWKCPWVES